MELFCSVPVDYSLRREDSNTVLVMVLLGGTEKEMVCKILERERLIEKTWILKMVGYLPG